MTVSDSAADVQAVLDALQGYARKINDITMTDSGTPILAVTASQFSKDAVLLGTLTENSPITDLNLSAVSLTGDRINEKVYNGSGTELDVLNSKCAVISQLLFSQNSEAQLHLLGVNPSIVHLM